MHVGPIQSIIRRRRCCEAAVSEGHRRNRKYFHKLSFVCFACGYIAYIVLQVCEPSVRRMVVSFPFLFALLLVFEMLNTLLFFGTLGCCNILEAPIWSVGLIYIGQRPPASFRLSASISEGLTFMMLGKPSYKKECFLSSIARITSDIDSPKKAGSARWGSTICVCLFGRNAGIFTS